jgi:regulator of sirC expression with transglutaminase-like and TPR domain
LTFNDEQNDAQRFEACLGDLESPGALARAALLIAKQANTQLNIDQYLSQLDADAATIMARKPEDAPRSWIISQLNYFLFEERGYRGNQEDYYNPLNSLLNEVMDRRLGIPITLSIVYMELGRRLGLPLEGIAFPGHFLVKCPMDRGVVVLDPFHAGISLSEDDLRERLVQQGVTIRPDQDIKEWLQAASQRAIISRLLRNLKKIYSDTGQLAEAIRILDFLLIVDPGVGRDLQERGNLYRRLECWGAAVSDLEAALASHELEMHEAEQAHQALVELRSRPRLLH